jgi:peroxiredoxin
MMMGDGNNPPLNITSFARKNELQFKKKDLILTAGPSARTQCCSTPDFAELQVDYQYS